MSRADVRDPMTCRRALREIGEIAAIAVLPDSKMTGQEALQTIAAVADGMIREAPGLRADCEDVLRRINGLTERGDLDALPDREALDLFGEVLGALEASPMPVFD